MKKFLFIFLFIFLFSTMSIAQQEVIPVTSAGESITATFPYIADEGFKFWYVPFRVHAGGIVYPDTSSLTPPKTYLEAGVWGLAFKFDSSAACSDGAYDSIYVWMKPMMRDGRPSTNDSTFLKMGATNPSDYTSTSAQRFTPIPSNRTGDIDYWYTCTLAGEIWPFAGVIFGITFNDDSGIINPTFRLYRFR